MKIKIGLALVIVMAVVGWSLLQHPTASQGDTAFDAATREKDARVAASYITGSAKGDVLLDESNAAAQNEIGFWEAQILSYVKGRALKNVDSAAVHGLAVRTASLFSMLEDATCRAKDGLEPYTPQSGFKTMALVVSMESEFKGALGVTFSDFINSVDGDLIKSLF